MYDGGESRRKAEPISTIENNGSLKVSTSAIRDFFAEPALVESAHFGSDRVSSHGADLFGACNSEFAREFSLIQISTSVIYHNVTEFTKTCPSPFLSYTHAGSWQGRSFRYGKRCRLADHRRGIENLYSMLELSGWSEVAWHRLGAASRPSWRDRRWE